MQKTSFKKILVQWLLPIVVLIGAVAIIVISFAVESHASIKHLFETNNQQVGRSYCENIISEVTSNIHISNVMHDMLENRGDVNVSFVLDTVDTTMQSGDAYAVAYCYLNGSALFSEGMRKELNHTTYIAELQGTKNFITFTEDDGITGQEAVLYVNPVEYGDQLKGFLITYIHPEVFNSVFEDSHFGEDAYYAVVDEEGNVLWVYGNSRGTTLLQEDFWNSLRSVAQGAGTWSVFDRQRQNGENGILSVTSGTESRTLYSFPISGTTWSMVMALDEAYVADGQLEIWEPIKAMVVKLIAAFTLFILLIIAIHVISRIQVARHNHELEDKADTDLLTELNNKIATERKIKEYMSAHPSRQCVMFVLDVDNFKKINDTQGHAFGDEVLRELGMRLRSMFRMTDIMGRVGGDEFIIFLKDIKDIETVEREGRKLERFFEQFEVGEYVKYSITSSIGAAVFPGEGNTFEKLYKAADTALYTSKKNGKNQLTFYHNTVNK